MLSRHVLWHELAHTQQSRAPVLWASQPWLVALAAAAVAGLIAVPPWNVPGAAGMVALWGLGSFWPLETRADHQAGEALAVWGRVTLPPAEAAAVEEWATRLARRHRWALALEWTMYAAVAAAASGLVAAFAHH